MDEQDFLWIVEAKSKYPVAKNPGWHPLVQYSDGKVSVVCYSRDQARHAARWCARTNIYNQGPYGPSVFYRAVKYARVA